MKLIIRRDDEGRLRCEYPGGNPMAPWFVTVERRGMTAVLDASNELEPIFEFAMPPLANGQHGVLEVDVVGA